MVTKAEAMGPAPQARRVVRISISDLARAMAVLDDQDPGHVGLELDVQPVVVIDPTHPERAGELPAEGIFRSAAGNDANSTNITVPSDEWWEILAYIARLVTGVAAAARSLRYTVSIPLFAVDVNAVLRRTALPFLDTFIIRSQNSVDIAASQTGRYAANPVSGQEFVEENAVIAAASQTALPTVLPPGTIAQVATTLGDAGDTQTNGIVMRRHKTQVVL